MTGYLHAWETNAAEDIALLFTEHAEYHESPFETAWIGRDEIVDGWRSRWNWQQGGWRFEWGISELQGWTAVVTGVGHYTELGDFDNVWTLTFDESGRCIKVGGRPGIPVHVGLTKTEALLNDTNKRWHDKRRGAATRGGESASPNDR